MSPSLTQKVYTTVLYKPNHSCRTLVCLRPHPITVSTACHGQPTAFLEAYSVLNVLISPSLAKVFSG